MRLQHGPHRTAGQERAERVRLDTKQTLDLLPQGEPDTLHKETQHGLSSLPQHNLASRKSLKREFILN